MYIFTHTISLWHHVYKHTLNIYCSDEEDADYKVPSYSKYVGRDFTASPSLNKNVAFGANFTDWGPYSHPASCKCDSCEDHMLQLTHLDLIDTLCIYKLKTGTLLSPAPMEWTYLLYMCYKL